MTKFRATYPGLTAADIAALQQAGTETVTVGASTAEASVAVVFAAPFASTPSIVTQQRQGSASFYLSRVGSPTATGFTLYAEKTGTSGSSTIAVDWIAVAR